MNWLDISNKILIVMCFILIIIFFYSFYQVLTLEKPEICEPKINIVGNITNNTYFVNFSEIFVIDYEISGVYKK